MKLRHGLLFLAAIWPHLSLARPSCALPEVTSDALRKLVDIRNIMARLRLWEEQALAHPRHHRMTGSVPHNQTIQHIVDTLVSTGYYDVDLQPFELAKVRRRKAAMTVYVDGEAFDGFKPAAIRNTKSANMTSVKVVEARTLGCDGVEDWPPEIRGNIGLVARSQRDDMKCTLGTKSAIAGVVGAVGLIVYESEGHGHASSIKKHDMLGAMDTPPGPTIPTIGIAKKTAEWMKKAMDNGSDVTVDFYAMCEQTVLYSFNVIATTKIGDINNIVMMGAHTDTASGAPGINDNGSAASALLEVAKQLANFSVTNAVRFGFWTAEELGVLGSLHYISRLSERELDQIRLYLNYDMLGSKNGVVGILEGYGQDGIEPSAGQREIARAYEDYFISVGENYTSLEDKGRSDHRAFWPTGIPVGSITSGADGKLTHEESALFHDGEGHIGKPHDGNYHTSQDRVANLAPRRLDVLSQAVAHAAALNAVVNLDAFPRRSSGEKIRKAAEEMALEAERRTLWVGHHEFWDEYFEP